LCTSTPQAQQVTDNVNMVVAQMKKWVSSVLFAFVFTNVGNKLMLLAVFNSLWIYLTNGYIFDEEFDSKRLRQIIQSKRRTGLIMAILGVILVTLGALNKLLFYGTLH
jgi:hypothetical protein